MMSYSHRLKHLRRTDGRLSDYVALRNHHLLRKEHLTRGDLNTQISTCDHNTIARLENLVKVRDTLLILDLHDDLNVRAVRAKHGADVVHVLRATDEGREDHVDVVLDAEFQVVLVLIRKRGQVDVRLREVDTLTRREGAVVDATHADVRTVDGKNQERQDTIVDVDELAGCSDLGQVFLQDNLAYILP